MIKLIARRKELKREQEFVRQQELERDTTALLGRVEHLLDKCQAGASWPEPRYQW